MEANKPIVLITGAGKGAGAKIAKILAGKGFIIAANDITPINVEQVAADITADGGEVSTHVHDIAKKLDTQALINDVIDLRGRIDILINNANVDLTKELLTVDEWDLHRVFEVNIIGTILMCQSVGRVMRQQGHGSIFNVLPNLKTVSPTQHASIAALKALTRQAKEEFKNYAIELEIIENANAQKWATDYQYIG